ncbi:MAG: ABC transporter permease [Thermoproteus sp.]
MNTLKITSFSLLGVLLLFFLYPLLLLIYLGWGSLASALATGSFLQSIGLTVLISTASAATAVVLGIPTAYALARYEFRLKELVEAAIDIPIVVPHTIVGIMVVLAFAAYGLGPALGALGLKVIDALPGAIIAVSYLSATYAVRTIESAIRMLDPELENVARSLGAGPFRAFTAVVLPNIRRAVANGALLAWARAVSESGALLIVAYYIIWGRTSIYPAPIYIYQAYIGLGLEEAVKYSAALLLIVLAVFIAYRLALGRVGAKRS